MSQLRSLSRTHLVVLALAVAVAAAAWWRFGRGSDITAVAAMRGTAVEIVYATGAVEPVRWAKVTSLMRNRIIEMCYCEGKTVAKGDVLMRLDDREPRAQLEELKAREKLPSGRWSGSLTCSAGGRPPLRRASALPWT